MWSRRLDAFLRTLEDPTTPDVRRFRRSFSAGNKQHRVKPQLDKWVAAFEVSCVDLDDPREVVAWFDKQSFGLSLGQKRVTLHTTPATDLQACHDALINLLAEWLPDLESRVVHKKSPPMISNKKMKQASRAIKQLNSRQKKQINDRLPTD